jgi:hypothetical protein
LDEITSRSGQQAQRGHHASFQQARNDGGAAGAANRVGNAGVGGSPERACFLPAAGGAGTRKRDQGKGAAGGSIRVTKAFW